MQTRAVDLADGHDAHADGGRARADGLEQELPFVVRAPASSR